jgi:hypothetical protein
MKQIRFNLLAFAAIVSGMLLLTACPRPEHDNLSVSHTELTFSADDTKKESVDVTTNVDSWSYQKSADWVTVEKNGYVLNVSVRNYDETGNARETDINLVAGDADPIAIKVTQNARDGLSINPESISYEANETGNKPVSIQTNVPGWDATKQDNASWLGFNKQDNTLTVIVLEENAGTSPRSAAIKVTAGNAFEKTLTVTQAGRHTLSLSPSSLSFDDRAGSESVTVNTTASSWEATDNASWIEFNREGNTLKVDVTANNGSSSREGTITVTAGSAPPVTLRVTQSAIATYLNADGKYLGDYYSTGTALFTIDLFDLDTDDGLYISAFCTMPSNPNNFRPTPGTYALASTGVTRTFLPGTVISDTRVNGTIVYNFNTKKFIPITSGTFTLEVSGDTYTITTDFTGRDHSTGATVNNIRKRYTGSIVFEIPPPPVPSSIPFAKSDFSATGTPPLNSGWPTSWKGTITPTPSTGTANYYTVSQWGLRTDPVNINYISSSKRLMINNTTRAFVYNGLNYYFQAVAYNQSTGLVDILSSYEVRYNESTNTLDFSGTSGGLPVYVGYVAQSGNTVSMMQIYANLKFTLTERANAPMHLVGNTVEKISSKVLSEPQDSETILKTDRAPSVITAKKAPK